MANLDLYNQLKEMFEGIRDERRMYANTAVRIGNAFLTLLEWGWKTCANFLRKDKDDRTPYALNVGGKLTAETLLHIGEYLHGIYGAGGMIDAKGRGELTSLFIREELVAARFVYNDISITKGEWWNTNGFCEISDVDTEKHLITVRIDENDYGSLRVGDICRGIYADIGNAYGSDSIADGSTDGCGFTSRRGYFTSYFFVKRIVASEKGKFIFEYGKRSDETPNPCPMMNAAQYGSFTDDARQSSMYFSSRGKSYVEILAGVNTWEVQPQNRVARYGNLDGFVIHNDDGTTRTLRGDGLFVQDNVYFGGAVISLHNISDLDDLQKLAGAYDVQLSQYQGVLTVDDTGNVIGGLWTEATDDPQKKQYQLATTVYVRKGDEIMLEEDSGSDRVSPGHYRMYAVSEDCDVMVENSTVFVTAVRNIKDGVAGSDDDADFDYDQMRRMDHARVSIVVNIEDKVTKNIEFPIRIQHDSLPFMVCDLTNEHAAVAWNTLTNKYIGMPVETTVNLYRQNEPWQVETIAVKGLPDGLKAEIAPDGRGKRITVSAADDFTEDTLPQVSDINITVTGKYAGASYEYTKTLTLTKSADTTVYEVVPSVDCIGINKKGQLSVSGITCRVFATSSDDKRYEVIQLPDGYKLRYAKNGAATEYGYTGAVAVSANDTAIDFSLYDKDTLLDKESVPVIRDGLDSSMALASENIISVPVDSRGISINELLQTVELRLVVDGEDLTVANAMLYSTPANNMVNADIRGSLLTLSAQKGTAIGFNDRLWTIKVEGKRGNVTHTAYVAVTVVPNVIGRGVTSVNTFYALSEKSTARPADTDFTYDTMGATVIAGNADRYLWSADKVAYTDGSADFSGHYLVGRCSELATVTEQYAVTQDENTPGSGWSDTYPGKIAQGDYVWSRDRILWKNGSVTYSSAQLVGRIGKDGDAGKEGNGISSQTNFYIATALSEGVTPQSPASGWVPGVFQQPQALKPYVWRYTHTVYTDGRTQNSPCELIAAYNTGVNANLLDATVFDSMESMRKAWDYINQTAPQSGVTIDSDYNIGILTGKDGYQGKNAFRGGTAYDEKKIKYKEILRQPIQAKLKPSTWYTLSYWMACRADSFTYSDITGTGYPFKTYNVQLKAGRTYDLQVTGFISGDAKSKGKTLRVYIYNDGWTWSKMVEIDSTSSASSKAEFNDVPSDGNYKVDVCSFPQNTTVAEVTVSRIYLRCLSHHAKVYVFPGCVDTSVKGFIDGSEQTLTADAAVSVGAGNYKCHTLTFRTKDTLPQSGQYVLFRLLPSLTENGNLYYADICMPKLEEGMMATGYLPSNADLKGNRGPIPRGPQAWSDVPVGVNFLAGNDGEEFIDIVLYDSNLYYCQLSHVKGETTLTPDKDKEHWKIGSNYDFVATKILLANYALVKNLGVETIDMRDAEGNVLFQTKGGQVTCNTGVFSNVKSKNGTWMIDEEGNFKATNGEFYGDLSARTFSLAICDSEFNGSLALANKEYILPALEYDKSRVIFLVAPLVTRTPSIVHVSAADGATILPDCNFGGQMKECSFYCSSVMLIVGVNQEISNQRKTYWYLPGVEPINEVQ